MFSRGKLLLTPIKFFFYGSPTSITLDHVEIYILCNRSKRITDEKALDVIFGFDSEIEQNDLNHDANDSVLKSDKKIAIPTFHSQMCAS